LCGSVGLAVLLHGAFCGTGVAGDSSGRQRREHTRRHAKHEGSARHVLLTSPRHWL